MAEPQLKPARKGSVAYRKLLKQLSDDYYKSVSEPVLGETIAEGKSLKIDLK